MAILIEVKRTKVVHRATANRCITRLAASSDETRDRIAVSHALLGRLADRRKTACSHLPDAPQQS